MCRDRVFYVVTECGQDQRALCCDIAFCVVTELVKARSFSFEIEYLCVVTEFGLGHVFFFFFFFCVGTKYFMSRQSMAKREVLCCDRKF